MTNTPTPLDGLVAACQDFVEYSEGFMGSGARDEIVRALAVYEYTAPEKLSEGEVLVRMSEAELNALNELVSNASYAAAIDSESGPVLLKSDTATSTFEMHLEKIRGCLVVISRRFFEAESR